MNSGPRKGESRAGWWGGQSVGLDPVAWFLDVPWSRKRIWPTLLITVESKALDCGREFTTLKNLKFLFFSIAAGGVMDVNTALQEVLKTALIHDGLYTVLSVYHLRPSHVRQWEGSHCLKSTARSLKVVPHAPGELVPA